MSKILNQRLYDQVKKEAKQRFAVWPSAYASGWLVQEYKRRGGKYSGKKSKSKSRGLSRWYAEKWINICKLPKKVSCGRKRASIIAYPYCRPSRRINKETPTTAYELTERERKRRCSVKRRAPSKKVKSRKR
jgi:hypothetical protein